MKILALDQARMCGYAYGVSGTLPITRLLDMGKTGTPSPEYLWRWGQTVKELIDRYDPDVLGYERPFFSAKTASSGERLLKMAGVIEVIGYAKRVKLMQIGSNQWKKTFCGNGGFSKTTLPYPPLVECEQRGIEVDGDHNRADAAGIWFHIAVKEDPNSMKELDAPLFSYKR